MHHKSEKPINSISLTYKNVDKSFIQQSGCKLLQTEGKSLEMSINKGFFCFCNVLKIAFYNKITTIQRKMQIKKPDAAGQ